MTAERRLAKLEGALSPKAATLLWLTEAHEFGSLPAYVAWLVDQPVSAAPMERVPTQARAAAVEALRGQPREAVREAAHGAVRDAIFLVELVLKINVAAEEAIRIEGLRYAALFWEMRAISAEAELETGSGGSPGRRTIARRWAAWRNAVSDWLASLYTSDEARLLLEHRYLDGHPALFPDAIEDWGRLRERAEGLAGLGDARRALIGGTTRSHRSARGLGLDALRTRARIEAPALAARLVDDARTVALDILGVTEGATSIMARRLHPTGSDGTDEA